MPGMRQGLLRREGRRHVQGRNVAGQSGCRAGPRHLFGSRRDQQARELPRHGSRAHVRLRRLQPVRLAPAQRDAPPHPHDRGGRHHRDVRHRVRPGAQGVLLGDVQAARAVRRAHHHELHRHGAGRGVRPVEPPGGLDGRRPGERAGLRGGAGDHRFLP